MLQPALSLSIESRAILVIIDKETQMIFSLRLSDLIQYPRARHGTSSTNASMTLYQWFHNYVIRRWNETLQFNKLDGRPGDENLCEFTEFQKVHQDR